MRWPPVLILALAAAGIGFGAGQWWRGPANSQPSPGDNGGLERRQGPPLEEGEPDTGMWHRPLGKAPEIFAERDNPSPYSSGSVEAPDQRSVTTFDPDRTQPGYNLVVSAHAPGAQLLDLKGNVLHEWALDVDEVWPERPPSIDPLALLTYWRRAELVEDGALLAVFEGLGLIKVDRDSNLLWSYQGGCHHDITRTPDGKIYTLARERMDPVPPRYHRFPLVHKSPFFAEYIVRLSADGEEEMRLSILDALVDSDFAVLLTRITRNFDPIHPNTVQIFDGSQVDRHPAFAAGNLMVCLRNVNAVVIIDPRQQRAVWALTDVWLQPHEPTLLANGNLLVFDNMGDALMSQVVEFDPVHLQVVWRYRGSEERPFSSRICGSTERLPNGNTLIVETLGGRAFEVTPDHKIVWEYWNPHRAGPQNEFIASLFDCVRIDAADCAALLPQIEGPR